MKPSSTFHAYLAAGRKAKTTIEVTLEDIKAWNVVLDAADAFDWLSRQNVTIQEYVLGDGDENNGGFQGVQIYFYEDDRSYHGKDLLECVRKARGEGKPVVNKKLTTERARGEE